MSLLKKVDPNWQPSEKRDLKVGETIEVDNFETLVRTGQAVLVSASGEELEMPGQVFVCPVCFQNQEGLHNFTAHVSSHLQKSNEVLEEAKTEAVVEPTVEATPEVPTEEVKVEPVAEVVEETPVVETPVEAPVEEVKEEAKVEEAPLYVSKAEQVRLDAEKKKGA